MAFIQTCYISKNTPELRKKIEELGYYRHPSYVDNGQYLYLNRGFYHTNVVGYSEEIDRMVDCGENEDLFLALAALRDDTPINSFYYYKERLCKCEKLELKDLNFNIARYYYKCRCIDNPMICFCCEEKDLHKATIEEIKEHFKK